MSQTLADRKDLLGRVRFDPQHVRRLGFGADAGPVEAQNGFIVALQRCHQLERMTAATTHHAAGNADCIGDPAGCQSIGEVPRRHPTGVGQERGDVVRLDPGSSSEARFDDVDDGPDPPDVLTEMIGDGGSGARGESNRRS